MTTNQTIDGVLVSRALLERIISHCNFWHDHPYLEAIQGIDKELRALLDAEQVAQSKVEPFGYWLAPKGQPLLGMFHRVTVDDKIVDSQSVVDSFDATALYAEPPAPVAAFPDGYCIMPRQLTAENGAKALLLGEFKLLVTKECPECCELEEPVEGCSICDGEGEYGQKHTIPWDQIKFIYSKAVSGLAMKAESAKT